MYFLVDQYVIIKVTKVRLLTHSITSKWANFKYTGWDCGSSSWLKPLYHQRHDTWNKLITRLVEKCSSLAWYYIARILVFIYFSFSLKRLRSWRRKINKFTLNLTFISWPWKLETKLCVTFFFLFFILHICGRTLYPSNHTTSFWCPYNIHNVKTTSYGCQNNVMCVLGCDIRFLYIRLFFYTLQ